MATLIRRVRFSPSRWPSRASRSIASHKGSLYARARLADYWIVNLRDRVLEMYREPVSDPSAPFGWNYARCDVLDASARGTPLAAPHASVAVAQLLP